MQAVNQLQISRMSALHVGTATGCCRIACPAAPYCQHVTAPNVARLHAEPAFARCCLHPTGLCKSNKHCGKPLRVRTTRPSLAATAAATSQTAVPPVAAAATTPADPCLDLSGVQAKAVGTLIGSMCGNALGAQVEPEKHYRLARLFPDGLHDLSWSFDISPTPLPAGHVTGDYVTMLAVALSLARCRGADTFDIVNCLASSFMQSFVPGNVARYSPYTQLTLEALAAGTNPFLLAHHVEGYMSVTPSRASQSCSHRPDRQLHGITDFSAVVRAVPVGVAYREASAEVLGAAVDAVVLITHPTGEGREGAAVIAAAVAWLMRADPATATPGDLLLHLMEVSSHSQDMTAKLQLLQQRLPRMENLGLISNWSQFWASAEWSHFTGTANLLWKQNLAVQGTQAAAVALWVLLASWQHPKQAVMLAASLGGYAGTTGALVGALVGALHGCSWVPRPWWDQLSDQLVDGEGLTEAEKEEWEHEGIAASPRSSVDQGQDGSAATRTAENEQTAAAEGDQAAAGQEADVEGENEEPVDPLSQLRVGKYATVMLGHELAALSCTEPPRVLQ